jgi:protein-tyrosine phosphatase
MLRTAAAAGTRTIVATPHVSSSYPETRAVAVRSGVRALQAEADTAGIDVRLVAGAELELMHLGFVADSELAEWRLGDSPYALTELPFSATAQFAETLLDLHDRVRPAVLAHPERCRAFHQDAELLGRLVDAGLLVQVTAASLVGSYGTIVQRCAWTMLEQGLVHVIASDAHDAIRRPPLLREPLEAVGLVEHLCHDGLAAILAGERPDPAPPVAPPRAVRRKWMLANLRGR